MAASKIKKTEAGVGMVKRQKKQIRECSSAGGVNAAELSGKLSGSKFEDIDLYLLMLPGIILVLVFRFVPLYGLTIAFKNYDMSESIFKSSWVGLKWFRILFESPDFFRIFRNTILINIYDVIFVFGGSIVFAILINEIQSKAYKKVVQTISYLPHFLSWVVVGGMIIKCLSTVFRLRREAVLMNTDHKIRPELLYESCPVFHI